MARVAIMVTGYEVLLGETTDTNGPFLARELASRGFTPHEILITGDDRPSLVATLRRLVGEVEGLILTGGLGPTEDDHTREAFAEAFDAPLVEHPELRARLEQSASKRRMSVDGSLKQALIPTGAEPLLNDWGIASGFVLRAGGTWCYTLPGVPREAEPMWRERIAPHLMAQFAVAPPLRESFWTFGAREQDITRMISTIREHYAAIEFGYRATLKGVQLKIERRPGAAVSDAEFHECAQAVKRALGPMFLSHAETTLEAEVARELVRTGLTIAVGESYTGGVVAHQLTNVAGSSHWFRGGIVAYQAEHKRELLDVPSSVLDREGVYSEATAIAMAEGARRLFGADIGIGTTGVASPSENPADPPAGTIFHGLALPGDLPQSLRLFFGGGRESIKRLGANAALFALLLWLRGR